MLKGLFSVAYYALYHVSGAVFKSSHKRFGNTEFRLSLSSCFQFEFDIQT